MERDTLLIALRDFFAAADGRAMAAACAAMDAAAGTRSSGTRVPEACVAACDPDELEYAFNRLFVGPGRVAAPPYASVYLDPEPRLKGEAARTAAAVYETLGLAVPGAGSLPEDHLAFELDAVLAFHEAFRRSGAGAESPELVALWGYFLFDHLARWVPLFLARIRQAQDVPAEIRRAASLLAAWLSAETGETGESPTRPAPTMHQPGGTA